MLRVGLDRMLTVAARAGWIVALGFGALAAGCGGGLPPATPGDAMRAHVQLADLEHGRSLVSAKCGGCHAPPLPAAHAGGDWPRSLDEMAVRSHLDVAQRQLIEAYLVTMATRPLTAAR
ncbi:MAG TPA: hypothetical protein VH165_29300 [Kofleriaceae bacterium]|jgi:hypothetical protein|nr:hypothetical protein [Kofleriaceae bacterium]